MFENLKSLSEININSMQVQELFGNKGAFLSSANLKTTIRVKDVSFIGDVPEEIVVPDTVVDSDGDDYDDDGDDSSSGDDNSSSSLISKSNG